MSEPDDELVPQQTDDVDRRKAEPAGGVIVGDIAAGQDAYIAGNINIYPNINEKPQESQDPTERIELSDEDTAYTLEEGLAAAFGALKHHRLLLVECQEMHIARSGAVQLARQLNIADKKHWLILTVTAAGKRRGREKTGTLDDIRINRSVIPNSSLIIMDLLRESKQVARDMLESFLAGSGEVEYFESLRSELHSSDLYVVCLSGATGDQATTISSHVPRWRIDALRVLLRHHFASCAETYERKLTSQIAQGIWGQEEEVISAVRAAIRNGTLPGLLDKQTESKQDTLTALIDQQDELTALRKALLYSTTFFSDLSGTEFLSVLHVVIANQSAEVEELVPEQDKDGKSVEVKRKKMVLLVDQWRIHRAMLMQSCKVGLVPGIDGRTRVQFHEPRMRVDARTAFELADPFYLVEQFERLQAAGLLFDPSLNIAKNIVELIKARMLDDPDSYGHDWLFDWVFSALVRFEIVRQAAEQAEENDVWRYLPVAKRLLFISRMAMLLAEMFPHRTLRRLASQFMDALIERGLGQIALDFAWELRSIAEFDTVAWLKKLLGTLDKDLWRDAFELLYDYAHEHAVRRPEIATALRGWRVPPSEVQDRCTHNQWAAALAVAPVLCLDGLNELPARDYGKGKSIFPVFSGQDVLTLSPCFASIVWLLCHRDQPLYWNDDALGAVDTLLERWLDGHKARDGEAAKEPIRSLLHGIVNDLDVFDALIALLMAEWGAMLLGLERNAPPPKGALDALETACQHIGSCLPEARRARILKFLANLREHLIERAGSTSSSSFAVSRAASARWNCVRTVANTAYASFSSGLPTTPKEEPA